MNYAMDHYIMKPKCKSLLKTTCANCTKIAIDDYSYLHSGSMGTDDKGDFWHAVPFPGDFHWTPAVKQPFPWEKPLEERPTLVSYIGSTQVHIIHHIIISLYMLYELRVRVNMLQEGVMIFFSSISPLDE